MTCQYKFYLIIPICLLTAFVSPAQNIPDMNITSPSGGVTTVSQPPMLNNGLQPSYVRVYTPKIQITFSSNLNPSTSSSITQMMTEYKDGFNKTVQTINHNVLSGPNKNLVTPYNTRFKRDEISYLPFASSNSDFNPSQIANQYAFYTNQYPLEGYTSYSIGRNISNNSQRATKALVSGKSQVGQNRGTVLKEITNTANQVIIWNTDASGKPVHGGFYAPNSLIGLQTYDTSGGLVISFKDADGRLIYTSVLQDVQSVGGGGAIDIYGSTYYVYDKMNRLVCVMPPKASQLSSSGLSNDVYNILCYQYHYDSQGRLSGQRFPGEAGLTEMVYDPKNRLVMRRTPNEQNANQWEITFFDIQNRIKATSIYSNSSSRIYWQGVMDAAAGSSNPNELTYYLLHPTGEQVYPGESAIGNNVMMSYTFYDDYKVVDPTNAKWNDCEASLMFMSEKLNTLGSEDPVRASYQHGRVTGSKLRILTAPGADQSKTGDWREVVNFYDRSGRVTYMISRDLYQGTPIHTHYTAMQYDFSGHVIYSKHIVENAFGSPSRHTEWSHNEFDLQTGRATKSWHKIDSSAWVLQKSLSYDVLGRTQREILGNYGETRDYNYNIRGQLTGINSYYTRTGDRQGESRSFGESLCYDYGFTQPRYDGKISGMLWRGSGSSLVNAYGYGYDLAGRLVGADYRRYEPPSGGYFNYAWRNDIADYSVNNLKYDREGNILSANRRGVQPGGGIVTMDQLSYQYENAGNSNRLTSVFDTASVYNLGDFVNTNGTGADYVYDLNGNVVQDNNKGITSITYNQFNKPEAIIFSGGTPKSILYSYDAGGTKVQEITTIGTTIRRTDYVGNFIYENDELRFAVTDEGRSVFDGTNNQFTEEYFVKDHLGNIRSVVEVYVPPMVEYLASYEVASANLEGMFFDHMDEIRGERPGGEPGNEYAGNLNGGDPERRIGTSILLKVMAGDKVEMNVNNFYEGYDVGNDDPVSFENMLASITSTLSGGSGGFIGSESHNIKTVSDVFTSENYQMLNELISQTTDPNKPKAYLNYVLFDENFSVVTEMSGAFQANGEGDWSQIGTTTPLEIPTNGYLAVYLSNSSLNTIDYEAGEVHFDQMVIRFSRGKLKEEAHYYPYGLPMVAMSSSAHGFVENRRKFQGNEYVTDLGLNWMDFHNRQYDPQIARFLSIDPLADQNGQTLISPYSAMANNPLHIVDPDGLENMIYVVNLKSSGISQTDIRKFIDELNTKLEEFGLNIRYQLFEPEMGEDFNMAGLGETDAVIVVGEPDDVSNYIQNTLGVKNFYDAGKWGYASEVSAHSGGTFGNVSGASSSSIRTEGRVNGSGFETMLIFTFLHEAGHPARHPQVGYLTENNHTYKDNAALTWSGSTIYSKLTGKTAILDGRPVNVGRDTRINSYSDLLKKEYNTEYIKQMKQYFQSNYSKDNYRNRLNYPGHGSFFYFFLQ